jgi:hypothetical protein
MKKMVDAGTFLPMTDEEIIAEIRLLVSCFDEIHSYFSCGDYSPNLLMQVNGYLDQEKAGMLSELDKFLSLWIAYNPLGRRPVRRCHPIAIAQKNAATEQIMQTWTLRPAVSRTPFGRDFE